VTCSGRPRTGRPIRGWTGDCSSRSGSWSGMGTSYATRHGSSGGCGSTEKGRRSSRPGGWSSPTGRFPPRGIGGIASRASCPDPAAPCPLPTCPISRTPTWANSTSRRYGSIPRPVILPRSPAGSSWPGTASGRPPPPLPTVGGSAASCVRMAQVPRSSAWTWPSSAGGRRSARPRTDLRLNNRERRGGFRQRCPMSSLGHASPVRQRSRARRPREGRSRPGD
jgi:hypothetical protein